MATRQPWLKPAILTGALIPLAAIVIQAQRGTLSANPIAEALNRLGLLALIFLISALAMTPLRVLFGWTWPLRIRRMLGLLGRGWRFVFCKNLIWRRFRCFMYSAFRRQKDRSWNRNR